MSRVLSEHDRMIVGMVKECYVVALDLTARDHAVVLGKDVAHGPTSPPTLNTSEPGFSSGQCHFLNHGAYTVCPLDRA